MKTPSLVFLFLWVVLFATAGCKTILPPSDESEAPLDLIYTFPQDTIVNSALIYNGIAYYSLWTETAGGKPLGIQAYDLRDKKVRWMISNTTHHYLVLGDGRLFLIASLDDSQREITAIDIENGKTIWTVLVPSEGYEYEITYGDDKLFLGSGNTIYCLSASDGEVLWQKDLSPGSNIDIAWFGNTLVYSDYSALGYYDGFLYVRTSNSIDSQTLINGQYVVLDSQNGDEKWKSEFKIPKPAESPPFAVASRPTFEGESMFFIDWTGRSYLVNSVSGELVWIANTSYPSSMPIFKNRKVCFITLQSEIICLDTETGHEIWKASFEGLRLASPLRTFENELLVVADNFGTQRSELLQVDLTTGEEKRHLVIPVLDECYSCVTAVNLDGGVLYLVLRHSIVAINLTP